MGNYWDPNNMRAKRVGKFARRRKHGQRKKTDLNYAGHCNWLIGLSRLSQQIALTDILVLFKSKLYTLKRENTCLIAFFGSLERNTAILCAWIQRILDKFSEVSATRLGEGGLRSGHAIPFNYGRWLASQMWSTELRTANMVANTTTWDNYHVHKITVARF